MAHILVTGGAGFTQPQPVKNKDMFYVYLLESRVGSERYIGSTNNLRDRLQKHNDGKIYSTKRYRPWKLVYYEAYLTEDLARHREKLLKAHGSAKHQLYKRLTTPHNL